MSYGRLESAWPAHGSVLVDSDAAPAAPEPPPFEVREQASSTHSVDHSATSGADLSEAVTLTEEGTPADTPPLSGGSALSDVGQDASQGTFRDSAFSTDPFSTDPFTEEDDDDLDEPPPGDPFRDSGTLDDAIQRAQEQEERRQAARQGTTHDDDGFMTLPVSNRARQALAYEEELDDAEMAMFEDYDIRRGAGKGQFSVDRNLLDRVDLSKPLVESKPPPEHDYEDLLEMGDTSDMTEVERASAFSLSFGPPPLDLSEQRHKIEVCNEVLAELSRAIDASQGLGSGRACVQLLIDGTPHQYAVLFMGVETDSSGRIDAGRIIKNLNRRPESEHRRLLNMGVLNLIERALSSGVEELEEEAMDTMLQRVAGYQIRLGL